MYLRAKCVKDRVVGDVVLLNMDNVIAIINVLDDDKLEVEVANTTNHYLIEADDFIRFNGYTNGALDYIKDTLCDLGYKQNEIPIVEPNALSEICDVTFEFGRACLKIHKGMVAASRKFGLLDTYDRYEFDGGTMYFYKPGSETSDWSITCGRGSSTLVSDSVAQCRNAVKDEMTRQLADKYIPIKSIIVSNLPVRTMGYNYDDFDIIDK